MIYEGFPAYIKNGLKKTSHQLQELSVWSKQSNDYASFGGNCKTEVNGVVWFTSAQCIFTEFKKSYPNKYNSLSYEEFVHKFAKATGFKVEKRGDEDFFEIYHPRCSDRYTTQ
jgi:hypothetical protein